MSDQEPSDEQGPPDEAGKLGDDAKAVFDAARATASAYVGSFNALRRLFTAEVALARDALIRGLILLLAATVMLGTAYVLLTALLVNGLRQAGASWAMAIGIPLAVSLAVAVFSLLRARSVLRHADFEATRRQLKLGLRAPSAQGDGTLPNSLPIPPGETLP